MNQFAKLAGVLGTGLGTLCFGQVGPIAPPAGPVGDTGPDLQQIQDAVEAVDSRIVINSVNTPGDANSVFKITEPGSYVLNGDLDAASDPTKFTVLEIDASGVKVDLNGFRIGRFDGNDTVACGIRGTGDVDRVHVVGGYFSGVRMSLVDLQGSHNSVESISNDAAIVLGEVLPVSNALRLGDYARVTRSSIRARNGILCGNNALIENCHVELTPSQSDIAIEIESGIVRSCSVSSTDPELGSTGFRADAGVLENCHATGFETSFFVGGASTLTRCVSTDALSIGFRFVSGDFPLQGITARGCTSSGSSASTGFEVDRFASGVVLDSCVATGHETGFLIEGAGSLAVSCVSSRCTFSGFSVTNEGIQLVQCNASDNIGDGIRVTGPSATDTLGTRIERSTASRNGLNGLLVEAAGCDIVENTLIGNGTSGAGSGSGIRLNGGFNRVEGNHTRGNDGHGIVADIPGQANSNIVVRNVSGQNTISNYGFGIPTFFRLTNDPATAGPLDNIGF